MQIQLLISFEHWMYCKVMVVGTSPRLNDGVWIIRGGKYAEIGNIEREIIAEHLGYVVKLSVPFTEKLEDDLLANAWEFLGGSTDAPSPEALFSELYDLEMVQPDRLEPDEPVESLKAKMEAEGCAFLIEYVTRRIRLRVIGEKIRLAVEDVDNPGGFHLQEYDKGGFLELVQSQIDPEKRYQEGVTNFKFSHSYEECMRWIGFDES